MTCNQETLEIEIMSNFLRFSDYRSWVQVHILQICGDNRQLVFQQQRRLEVQ